MGESNVFTPVPGSFPGPFGGGGDSPRFFLRSLVPGPGPFQGVPQSWLTGGRGYPSPGQDYPSMYGVPPHPRPVRPGWGNSPARPGWGTPGQVRLGYPPPPPTPRTVQQSEHLLHGGRYAPCFHAGELSYLRYSLGPYVPKSRMGVGKMF